MKKILVVVLSLVLLSSCAKKEENSQISETVIEEVSGDAYSSLKELMDKKEEPELFSVGVISKYDFVYEDDTIESFSMDEVMQSADNIHLEQNINSNGLVSSLDGYYYDGKLYSKYNGITFYEEMERDRIKETLLFPIEPTLLKKEDIKKIEMGYDEDHYLTFIIKLDNNKALDIFSSQYDIYGINNIGEVKAIDNQIIYRFDGDDFIRGTSEFVLEAKSQEEVIKVNFNLNVNYFFINNTVVEIDEALKQEHSEYVHFGDIDTNSIVAKADEDSADTILETFKNRIVSRLSYEAVEGKEGVYRTTFNENEVYTIDFNNKTFMYTNYSIDYVYNWKGDVGSMGNCTFNFKNDSKSSDCNDTTIDTLKNVKSFLEMELYYCGLTINELISE